MCFVKHKAKSRISLVHKSYVICTSKVEKIFQNNMWGNYNLFEGPTDLYARETGSVYATTLCAMYIYTTETGSVYDTTL